MEIKLISKPRLNINKKCYVYLYDFKVHMYSSHFKYFWNSFKLRKLTINHYVIHAFLIISSVGLLGIAKNSWAPLIHYIIMLLYTLAYKPYK